MPWVAWRGGPGNPPPLGYGPGFIGALAQVALALRDLRLSGVKPGVDLLCYLLVFTFKLCPPHHVLR